VQDFTAGGINSLRSSFSSSGNPEFDRRIRQLVKDWGITESKDMIAEMIVTALRIGKDRIPGADLKLMNRSLKELHLASKTFAPYQAKRKIVIFGSARTNEQKEEYKIAEEFASMMRDQGYMIITGAGGGIMGAAQRGAGREQSFGLGIRLPFEQRANEIIDGDPKLVNFNYFFTRKLNFIKEADAVALFPGGFGTMDEGFECLTLMQTGKARIIPVVMIDKKGGDYWNSLINFLSEHVLAQGLITQEDFSLFRKTDDLQIGMDEVIRFYRNFHSYRWVGTQLVFRLQRQISSERIDEFNARFSDLFSSAPLQVTKALPQEANEPETLLLPRLICGPHRRHFGRMRQLINAFNEEEEALIEKEEAPLP
jgi:uncharacterized protein (TIGR00730 family)